MSSVADRRRQVRETREQTRARIVAAATELLRERSFTELTVDEVMRAAGQGRTIFYRHFDDLPDLLLRASRDAVEELYAAQARLGSAREVPPRDTVREALRLAVAVHRRDGPLLRAVAEAAAADDRIAAARERMIGRFDDLLAAWLGEVTSGSGRTPADPAQTARALNLLNQAYLLDAFGHEPRVDPEAAVTTLGEIWIAVSGV